MPSVLAYHRPGSLDEASTLLAGPNRRIIGGGTVVVPHARMHRGEGVEIVDLQGLGLDTVSQDTGVVMAGAMVRLGDWVQHALVPEFLAELARRELPSALRNQATIGGTVAEADADSVLLAGLLAYGAEVHTWGHEPVSLEVFLADGVGNRIVTAVSFHPDGRGAIAATGRTPADTPIVAAIAHQGVDDGLRLALTGVAPTPVLAHPADPTGDLAPVGDFRGSAAYRLHLVETLSTRALREVV